MSRMSASLLVLLATLRPVLAEDGSLSQEEIVDTGPIDKAVGKLVRMGAHVSADGGKITYVSLSDRKLSGDDLALFGLLHDLEILHLRNCRYGDRIFDYVKAMPHLEHLTLWGSDVTDDGLRSIRKLPLKELDLRATRVGDAGVAHLRDMKTLEKLDLLQTRVTDAGMVHLARLTRLKELSLISTRIGDEGLKHLSALTGLTELQLEGTRVTAKGLEHIAKLKKLGLLTLHRTAITDKSMASLSGLKHLETLYLCDTPITDEGLKHLEKISSLGVVYLSGTKVSDGGIKRLQRALPDCTIE